MGTLLFILTFLMLLSTSLMGLISLIRKRFGAFRKIGILMLAWLAVYGIVLLVFSMTSQSQVISRGQEHCFDEMCYSVKSTSWVNTLGSEHASGAYLLIDVQLRNASTRTSQKPSNPQMWLVGPQGEKMGPMLWGKGELAGKPADQDQFWKQRIEPGGLADEMVAFDLPAGMELTQLVISEGPAFPTYLIIDDENSFFHAKMFFQVYP